MTITKTAKNYFSSPLDSLDVTMKDMSMLSLSQKKIGSCAKEALESGSKKTSRCKINGRVLHLRGTPLSPSENRLKPKAPSSPLRQVITSKGLRKLEREASPSKEKSFTLADLPSPKTPLKPTTLAFISNLGSPKTPEERQKKINKIRDLISKFEHSKTLDEEAPSKAKGVEESKVKAKLQPEKMSRPLLAKIDLIQQKKMTPSNEQKNSELEELKEKSVKLQKEIADLTQKNEELQKSLTTKERKIAKYKEIIRELATNLLNSELERNELATQFEATQLNLENFQEAVRKYSTQLEIKEKLAKIRRERKSQDSKRKNPKRARRMPNSPQAISSPQYPLTPNSLNLAQKRLEEGFE